MPSSLRPPPGPAPHVLVADDDQLTRARIAGFLEQRGCKVEQVADGQHAVSRARDGHFDVVLIDVVMPGMSGLDACRLIKGVTQDRFLPVALLTAQTDVDSRVAGLRVGADDYICKPFDERELYERVNSLLRIKRGYDEIAEARSELERIAVLDHLTGLYNYRYLQSRLGEEFKRAERYREPLACLMIDLDEFKRVNETHGHDAGDAVIQQSAVRLKKAVRDVDVVTRYGGDEFLLVLPSTNFPGALTLADRVWHAIGDQAFQASGGSCHVTASVGVAVFPSRDIRSKDGLLKAADRALFEAKQEGRNRICVFQHQGYIYVPASAPLGE